MKNYIIIYEFKHSKFGFQNQITVSAGSEEEAKKKASDECVKTYGKKQIKRFSFKVPPFGTY